MELNERIKLVRKDLKMTQTAFGKAIGISRDTVANIENGRIDIKDVFIKAICREFNVDYGWLTTGVGEMFVDSDEDFLARVDAILVDENEDRRNMIKTLLYASDEDIEAVSRLVKYFYDLRHNKKEDD